MSKSNTCTCMCTRQTHSGERQRPPAAVATAAGEWAAQKGWAAADVAATPVRGRETQKVQDRLTHGAPAHLPTAQQALIQQQSQGRPVVRTAPRSILEMWGSIICSALCVSGIAQRFRQLAVIRGLMTEWYPAACQGSETSGQLDGCGCPIRCSSGRSASTATHAGGNWSKRVIAGT